MNFTHRFQLSMLFCLCVINFSCIAAKSEAVAVVETKTAAELKKEAAQQLKLVTTLTPEWFEEQEKSLQEQLNHLEQDRTVKQAKQQELQKNLEELTAQEKIRAAEAERIKKQTVVATATESQEQPLVSEGMINAAISDRSAANDEVEKIRLDHQGGQKFLKQLQQELAEQEKVATTASTTPEPTTSQPTVNATEKTVDTPPQDVKPDVPSAPKSAKITPTSRDKTFAESGYNPPAPTENTKTVETEPKKVVAAISAQEVELNKVALLKQAIELLTRSIEVMNQRYQLNNQYLTVLIQWNDILHVVQQSYLLRIKEKSVNEARTTLKRNQDALQFDLEDLPNKITHLETSKVTIESLEDMLDKAALDKETSVIEADNLKLESQSSESSLKKQQGQIEKQQEELEKLRKTPLTEPVEIEVQKAMITELENRLALQNEFVKLAQQDIELIKQRIEFRKKQAQLATTWYDKLQAVYHVRQQQFVEEKVQKEQQEHLAHALTLRKQLDGLAETASPSQRYLLKTQIQEANERAQQVRRQLKIHHIEEQMNQGYKIIEQKSANVYQKLDNLQSLVSSVDKLTLETKQIDEILQNKIQVFEQQRIAVKKRAESLTGMAADYNQQTLQLLEQIVVMLQQEASSLPPLLGKSKDLLALLEVAYKDTLQQALFRLRKLPSDIAGWKALFTDEMALLPHLFVQQAISSWQSVGQAVLQTSLKSWSLIVAMTLAWLLGIVQLIRWSKTHTLDEHSPSFIGQTVFLGLRLLRQNAISVTLIGIILILLWVTQPAAASIVFVLTLVLVWLGIKLLLSLSYILFQNESMKTALTQSMRWQLQSALIVVGIFTMITLLIHIEQDGYVLKVSLTARDVIDTIFMLLLSLLIIPMLRIRRVILDVWRNDISGYNALVLTLVSLLIPLIILVTSLLGLIGYISLSWSFAKHLSLFLMVAVATFVLEGLITDAITWWQKSMPRDNTYQLLWAESLLPLFHKLLSLAALGLGIVIFLWITGWYSDVAMRKTIASIFSYSLFAVGNNNVTVSDLLLASFTLWIVFWFGGWSRQVTYQFVYQAIVDLGVRQSLSAFTQYAVMFIGILIAMSIIGINLTTLTVFAGAIGVGIGFGLRDLINNFISGILLLVERPLRNGDFIEVGANQGRVKQIGIRSLTVRAIDGRDIIVPNSEVISKTFINWTLSDRLRRTTISINLSYDDDPNKVKEILLKLTEVCPEILRTPAPTVLLSDFTDYSMKISLNYFIDMAQAVAPIVKSKILFLIWEHFKVAGIRIPYPQQDVHLKTEISDHPLLTNDADGK